MAGNDHWGWTKDDEGLWVLPERVAAFVEFAVDPTVGKESTNAYGKRVGIDPRQLRQWKHDKRVRDNIEQKLAELNVNPERVQDVINALYRNACAGDTNSAKLYLQFVDRLAPPKIVVESASVEKMSDADLAAALDRARKHVDVTLD